MQDERLPPRLAAQLHGFADSLRQEERRLENLSVSERQLAIYRRLFRSNIAALLHGSFPVIRSIVSPSYWQQLVDDFFVSHRCQTPLFTQVAREFVDYLQLERRADPDFPFLAELAHYEWTEIELRHQPDLADAICVPAEDAWLDAAVGLSPLARLLCYLYPVHRIGADYLPKLPAELPVWLLVYRQAGGMVTFIESDAATALLLCLLEENPTVRSTIHAFAGQMSPQDPLHLQQQAQSLLRNWIDKGILQTVI